MPEAFALKDPHGRVRALLAAPVAPGSVVAEVYGLGPDASFFRLHDREQGWGLFASDVDDVLIDLEVRSPILADGQPAHALDTMLDEAVQRLLDAGWSLGPADAAETSRAPSSPPTA
ncbi:hypothetical protein [Derxia gummosa]|uniref:Uncharacterized protein n=1 Tax=Derxia gummosa DSM 723 TaxID=1121388 RepID=A0A8B6X1F3_9BURK|nr:hypothetical protein [Derxia gummosa]